MTKDFSQETYRLIGVLDLPVKEPPKIKEIYIKVKSDMLNLNSNAIGYVTSNFIGQLHLQVRVNFTFYHV